MQIPYTHVAQFVSFSRTIKKREATIADSRENPFDSRKKPLQPREQTTRNNL